MIIDWTNILESGEVVTRWEMRWPHIRFVLMTRFDFLIRLIEGKKHVFIKYVHVHINTT